MYGIINKSISELISCNYGVEKWEKIKATCDIDIEFFIGNKKYDDDITFKLAGVMAEDLGVEVDHILGLFGEWWILQTAKKQYGNLLESGGDNFKSFLLNLPDFHNRVMVWYPKLTPPEFQISDLNGNSLCLHYFSKRRGLTSFVCGLISGLGKFFNTEVRIELIKTVPEKFTHEIIKITWKNQ
ncbi:heme NO-binding domain-containing protein [Jiulongibacter sediminis]|uniref:heme NO-binding domain-containing protein n=1 Tax=Jiulongibacter sediminis TaxID=1605367 RepID=UPI0026E96244|nr:heme NO-binding domain-containing protein [Jiulongibacter sediminis]